jgi:hypothetical protein
MPRRERPDAVARPGVRSYRLCPLLLDFSGEGRFRKRNLTNTTHIHDADALVPVDDSDQSSDSRPSFRQPPIGQACTIHLFPPPVSMMTLLAHPFRRTACCGAFHHPNHIKTACHSASRSIPPGRRTRASASSTRLVNPRDTQNGNDSLKSPTIPHRIRGTLPFVFSVSYYRHREMS